MSPFTRCQPYLHSQVCFFIFFPYCGLSQSLKTKLTQENTRPPRITVTFPLELSSPTSIFSNLPGLHIYPWSSSASDLPFGGMEVDLRSMAVCLIKYCIGSAHVIWFIGGYIYVLASTGKGPRTWLYSFIEIINAENSTRPFNFFMCLPSSDFHINWIPFAKDWILCTLYPDIPLGRCLDSAYCVLRPKIITCLFLSKA